MIIYNYSICAFSQEKQKLNTSVEEKDKDIEEKNKTIQQVCLFFLFESIAYFYLNLKRYIFLFIHVHFYTAVFYVI